MSGVNYPELGTVDQATVFHPEGYEWTHPCGAVYRVIKREDGKFDWKLIRKPDGTEVA